MKKIKRKKNPKNREVIEERQAPKPPSEERISYSQLSKSINDNYEKFQAFLKESTDAVFRRFRLGINGIDCAIVYIDGLTDKTVIIESILRPMMLTVSDEGKDAESRSGTDNAYDLVLNYLVAAAEIKETDNLDEAMLSVMSGETALIIDGYNRIILISTRGWPVRGISEPETESVIAGQRKDLQKPCG